MLDPSIYGVVEAFCEKHDVEEIEILRALLLTVVDEHVIQRSEVGDQRAEESGRRPTTLEALEGCVHDQQVRNAAIRDACRQAQAADAPTYVRGLARGAAAKQQGIVLEIVREYIRQADLPEEDADTPAAAARAA